ncbi:MAG: radical SAM protein [Candidatus Bathyarchaeia archaeon]
MSIRKAFSIVSRVLTPDKPYHVQWMVTRKCNYRCRGCNVWREQDNNELSTEEIKRGLDIRRKLGVVEVLISGGNPLLREDIDEIIEYASRYFFVTVYDNGSLAAEKIDALRRANFVAISIDSLNPDKNDHIRGVKGAWKRAVETVERLHAEGINVSVTPTISQANLYEIIDFTKHFLDRGIPIWYSLYSYDSPEHSNPLFKIGKAEDAFLIKDRDAMVKVCDSLLKIKQKNDNVLITTKVLKAVKHLYLNNERLWKCRALQNFFVINHRGEVSGCHLQEPVGSIFELPDLWESEKLGALRKKYSECERCAYLCYIFYSIHGNVAGNMEIVKDKWRSVRFFLKRH